MLQNCSSSARSRFLSNPLFPNHLLLNLHLLNLSFQDPSTFRTSILSHLHTYHLLTFYTPPPPSPHVPPPLCLTSHLPHPHQPTSLYIHIPTFPPSHLPTSPHFYLSTSPTSLTSPPHHFLPHHLPTSLTSHLPT